MDTAQAKKRYDDLSPEQKENLMREYEHGNKPSKDVGDFLEWYATKLEGIEQVQKLMIEKHVGLNDVIDFAIESNGIIGVGLITLGDDLRKYVHNKI